MKNKVLLVLLAVAIACALPLPARAQQLPTGLTTGLTIEVGTEVREYDIFVPDAVTTGVRVPVVVDLHGFGSSPSQQRGFSGWQGAAERHGLAVVWPRARGAAWAWSEELVDPEGELAFFEALVHEVSARVPVDPARVYATGLSNGGEMAHTLACEAETTFAAFVAFAAGSPAEYFSSTTCTPVRPIPMLNFRGTTDDIVPYEGGRLPPFIPIDVFLRSASSEFSFWRDVAECTGSEPDIVENPGPETQCELYTDCGADAEVGLCSLRSTGDSGHVLYVNADGLDLAERAWDFMQRHPMPAEFVDAFAIDDALDGNWTDPAAAQQGLMLDYIGEAGVLFVAWFTYTADAVPPSSPPEPDVGAPGQRWLVASLTVDGTTATGDLVAPAGGAFEQPLQPDQASAVVGTMTIEFFGCDRGTVSYSLDTAGLSGTYDIQPLARVVAAEAFSCSPLAPAVE